ncbi:hypothetical protein EUGRSUZ_J01073 [Eucalyptus grandis]|uniref:Uncharacterized protein n=2 Tax=Eucalyptus grandis TaxID=71139 RepID=A0ACC3J4L8_EUCGR|nr:hypothetical protein EUGRSUZ_J01073 [Eucalyptus grandis]
MTNLSFFNPLPEFQWNSTTVKSNYRLQENHSISRPAWPNKTIYLCWKKNVFIQTNCNVKGLGYYVVTP